MSCKYAFPGVLVKAQAKAYQLSCTQTAGSINLPQTSKTLVLQNIGTNPVYVTFDDQPATTNGLAIIANVAPIIIDVQADKINAICTSAQTADLRVLEIF